MRGALRSGVSAGRGGRPPRGAGAAAGQRRRDQAEALLLLQLFPLRNLKRISIFFPSRASKLCCEQFGNSRRVSGSLAPAPKLVQALSCLTQKPRTSALN